WGENAVGLVGAGLHQAGRLDLGRRRRGGEDHLLAVGTAHLLAEEFLPDGHQIMAPATLEVHIRHPTTRFWSGPAGRTYPPRPCAPGRHSRHQSTVASAGSPSRAPSARY